MSLSAAQENWLAANADRNSFLTSLADQYGRKGYLSDKQVACVIRAMNPTEGAPAAIRTVAPVNTVRVEEIFGYARTRGIKQPQMRLGAYKLKTASSFSANAGMIYVTTEDGEYLGKINGGSWMPVAAGRTHTGALAALLANPELAARAYGERTGNCSICGRLLTDGESVDRMIGPVCAEKYGLN
jgi:hypothetical protein